MTKHRQIALLSFLLCLLFVIGTTHIKFTVSAVGEVPITLEPTLEAQLAATHRAEDAQWLQTYHSRSIFDFRIAYLIKGDANETETIVSQTNMQEALGAIPVQSWDEFIELNEQEPFHMVFIHSSMVDEVDKEWTRLAHRSGIFIIGINVRRQQLAEIIDDRCLKFGKKEYLDYVENTFLFFNYYASLGDERQRDFVNQSVLETCTDDFIGRGSIVVSSGKYEYPLYTKEALAELGISLITVTVNRGMP
jgi:hypothetical protein